VAMEHKAYAFDWKRFEFDLHSILEQALAANDSAELEKFIDRHRPELKDPYEGKPLPEAWREMLENRDVHEHADFALTLYYDPADHWGVGYAWADLSEQLPPEAADALLGFPAGPPGALFDPGRYGSYFQTPALVRESLAALRRVERPEVQEYRGLLERCAAGQLGVYVTF